MSAPRDKQNWIPVYLGRGQKRVSNDLRRGGWFFRLVGSESPVAARTGPSRLELSPADSASEAADRKRTERNSAGRTLRLAHVNVRSLVPSLDDVNVILKDNDIDVLCITETWLQQDFDSRFLIFPGYSVIRVDRPSRDGRNVRGGGICVLCRRCLRGERLVVPAADSPLESVWVSLGGLRSVVVGAVYRPPSVPAAATDDLHDQLLHLHSLGKSIFVLGDMNLDLLCPEKPGVRYYMQLLDDLNLKQIVPVPTRPSQTMEASPGTLIDHISIPAADSVTTAVVVPNSCSDHSVIIAQCYAYRRKPPRPEVTIRSTRSLSTDALCLDLLSADWSGVYEASDINDKWSGWLSVWSPIVDKHMPLVKIRPKHPPCPWLTNNGPLRDSMRARDQARAAYQRSSTPENRETFRASRNAVKEHFRHARSAFFAAAYNSSPETAWKDMRRFLISSKKSSSAPVDTTDPQWADQLNAHFAACGPRVAAETEAQREGRSPLPPRPRCVVSGSFRVSPATLPELATALSQMSKSKACGDDGITIDMIRMTSPVVGPHLLHVVNTSLVSGVLPDAWKIARVLPLHKSGSKADPNNYRPISILPTVAKLTERVVCNQLMRYLLSHNVLSDHQHGFRPGHSTESAMLDAVSFVVRSLDTKEVSCLTTADTSKAFDSVPHRRLLEKLGWYGIDMHWFENWLSGRHQCIGNGATAAVTHGVVQGH